MVSAVAIKPAATLDALLEGICVDLQITKTQREKAENRYAAIGSWLEEADSGLLRGVHLDIYSQGSLRIGTTVRPRRHEEFDLDIVAEFELDSRLINHPVVLLDAIEARLRENGRYKDKLERKNRCIRIVYADEFHLDILPGCPDPMMDNGSILVPDRRAQCWKASNPNGYATWFQMRCQTNRQGEAVKAMAPLPADEHSFVKPVLKKVVQLVKRNRDIEFDGREDLEPASIVLTTLAGTCYAGGESLIESLERFLLAVIASLPVVGPLRVHNSTNQKELLSEKWEAMPASYVAFKTWIIDFAAKVAQLRNAQGLQHVVPLLGQMFGEKQAEAARKALVESVEQHRSGGTLSASGANGALVLAPGAAHPVIPRNTFFGD